MSFVWSIASKDINQRNAKDSVAGRGIEPVNRTIAPSVPLPEPRHANFDLTAFFLCRRVLSDHCRPLVLAESLTGFLFLLLGLAADPRSGETSRRLFLPSPPTMILQQLAENFH